MVLYHIWISLPFPFMIFSAPQNIPIYLWSTSSCHLCYLWKLCYYVYRPFWYPTNSLSISWWYLHSIHHHEWKPFPYQYENRILLQVSWWENMLQKSRFDCSLCSMNKRVYCCDGPVIMGSQLRTCFIQNQHCIAFFTVYWCVWFPSPH